jgi:hypothetical protein
LGRTLIAWAILSGRLIAAGGTRLWLGLRRLAGLGGNAVLDATDVLADRWGRRRKPDVVPDEEEVLIDRLSKVAETPELSGDQNKSRPLGKVRSVRGE